MGKYDRILATLAPAPLTADEQTYQQKIDVIKEELRSEKLSAPDLAVKYRLAREKKERIERELYEANKHVEAVEQLLAESHEQKQEGWGLYGAKPNMIRFPEGGSVRVQPEPYPRVIDKEAFRLWCINNGYANALQLWPSTMAAVTKERLVRGESEPDGVQAFLKHKIVFTKPGAKEGDE